MESEETAVRDDILNRVVKGFNREQKKETAKLSLAELNERLLQLNYVLADPDYRETELLETVDVPLEVIEELDRFSKEHELLREEEADRIAYW